MKLVRYTLLLAASLLTLTYNVQSMQINLLQVLVKPSNPFCGKIFNFIKKHPHFTRLSAGLLVAYGSYGLYTWLNQKPKTLHDICKSGTLAEVQHCFSKYKNTNLEERDSCGNTPLYNAVINGNFTVAQYLVGNKANSDAIDSHGDTIFLKVGKDRNFIAMQWLKDKNANINARDNNNSYTTGKSLLIRACTSEDKKEDVEMVQWLIKNKAKLDDYYGKNDALGLAWKYEKLAIAKLLLEVGVKECNSCYRLKWALENKHFDIAEILVKQDTAIINKVSPNVLETLLHIMCKKEDLNTINWLLDHGATIDIKDCFEENCFESITKYNYKPDALKALLQHKSIINLNGIFFGCNKKLPLHWACEHGYKDIVNILLTRKLVDVNEKDDKDCTALGLTNSFSKDIITILKQHGAK